MSRTVAIGVTLALVSVRCLPGVRARGSVSSVSPDCANVAAKPLPKARVAVHCPNRHDAIAEVVTDGQGRFELLRRSLLPHACWVKVSAPEHEDAIYPVDHLCAVEGTVLEGCHGFAVQAELERRRPPPSDDETDDGED